MILHIWWIQKWWNHRIVWGWVAYHFHLWYVWHWINCINRMVGLYWDLSFLLYWAQVNLNAILLFYFALLLFLHFHFYFFILCRARLSCFLLVKHSSCPFVRPDDTFCRWKLYFQLLCHLLYCLFLYHYSLQKSGSLVICDNCVFHSQDMQTKWLY